MTCACAVWEARASPYVMELAAMVISMSAYPCAECFITFFQMHSEHGTADTFWVTKFQWGNVWHLSSNLQAQTAPRSWWPWIWILDISTHQVSSLAVLTSKCFSQRSFLQLRLVLLIKLKEIGTWLVPSICCLYQFLSVWKGAQFIILRNWMNLMTPRLISPPLNLPDTTK